jgi:hypothetical protein
MNQIEDKLKKQLAFDEKLLWLGQPRQGVLTPFRKSRVHRIIESTFSIMILKLLTACVLFFATLTSACADPILLGKWKSNSELSMKFNREKAVIQDKTALFLEQIMGHMIITLTPTRMTTDMPDVNTKSALGVAAIFHGSHESDDYDFLGSTPTQVAISSTESATGLRKITVFNFEDDNTMWVYLGGGNFPDMNLREYFVRQH